MTRITAKGGGRGGRKKEEKKEENDSFETILVPILHSRRIIDYASNFSS